MKRSISKYPLQAGFTLLEVLVTMGIFMIVLIIASNAFNVIVTQSTKYSKMEESNIEGVIGLEVMRHDLEQIGFGLPWGWSEANPAASGSGSTAVVPNRLIPSSIAYEEALAIPASLLNDAPSAVPRAIASSAVLGQFTTAYLALKGSTLGRTKASQRWTQIPYRNYSGTPWESRPVIIQSASPSVGDKVIMVTSNFSNEDLDRRLIVTPGTPAIFHQNFSVSGMSSNFLPVDSLQTNMVYGIDDDAVRMPFNRSDFFIKIPSGVTATGDGSLPAFCAPKTGILYKATVNHADGKYTYIPLLDCVADMQVVLGWDSSEGGNAHQVDVYSSLPRADGTVLSSKPALAGDIQTYLNNAKMLREHLKVVKVYILAQEGRVDPKYTAQVSSIEVGDRIVNGLYPTKMYSFSEAQKHYRWKLYRIVSRPKNLPSNQR